MGKPVCMWTYWMLCPHSSTSATHERWHEPVHCEKMENFSPRAGGWMIKVWRCQAGAPTKPWANKAVDDYTVTDWFSDFDHLPTSPPSLSSCGSSRAVCADLLVLSQLLSEWTLTHPPFGPLFAPRALDWRAFCWQLLTLPPCSKTSLLSCCRPSVCPRHSGRPSPRHCSYVAWAVVVCERLMCRITTQNLKS